MRSEGTPLRGSSSFWLTLGVFLVCSAAAGIVVWRFELHRRQVERAQVEGHTTEAARQLESAVVQATSLVHVLSALIPQAQGQVAEFEPLAERLLPIYPAVSAAGLAPNGVVRHIVPVAGNEAVLGHDLFADPLRKREALLARDTGALTLAGPMHLIQGGYGVVARLPVTLEKPDGTRLFWGLTFVVVRVPELIERSIGATLRNQGLDYELSRTHPDTGETQIIFRSRPEPLAAPIREGIDLPQAVWILSVAPQKGWTAPGSLWINSGIGLLASAFAAAIVRLALEFRANAVRQEAEKALRESEQQLRRAVVSSPVPTMIHAEDGQVVMLSESWCEISGYSRAEIPTVAAWTERAYGEDRERVRSDIKALYTIESRVHEGEFKLRTRDGLTRIWEFNSSALGRRPDGCRLVISVGLDVTDRKHAETLLRTSLQEKEALLKEVHHRVKNNLQVITSLLRLEGSRTDHPETRAVLQDMQHRIRSMALLHESLYRSGNFAEINLAPYIETLCRHLFRSMDGARVGAIGLQLELEPVTLSLEQAIPTGLIVNELASNALKHGFADGRPGEVRVCLASKGERVRLTVADTGVGLPPSFSLRQTQTLGLQLVSDLVAQLQGEIAIGPPPGAAFEISFTAERAPRSTPPFSS